MNNKFYYFYLILALALFACDPNGVVNPKVDDDQEEEVNPEEAFYPAWIGDYSVKSIRTVLPDGASTERLIEENLVRNISAGGNVYEYEKNFGEYPALSIFNEQGLYAHIPEVGTPYDPAVDPTTHVLTVKSPKRAVRLEALIVLSGGTVYTVYNGLLILPNPIKVQHVSADTLLLEPGEQFELTLTTPDGDVLGDVHACWEYGPILKDQDVYTFDAVLYVDPDSIVKPETYHRHIIFHKKNK